MKFLTQHRFSYFDMLWFPTSTYLLVEGILFVGIAVFSGGLAASLLLEKFVDKTYKNEKYKNRDHEWKDLAQQTRMIDAIKRYKSIHGTSSKEAKDAIIKYLRELG